MEKVVTLTAADAARQMVLDHCRRASEQNVHSEAVAGCVIGVCETLFLATLKDGHLLTEEEWVGRCRSIYPVAIKNVGTNLAAKAGA